jgi:hypothetical protein
LTVPVSGVYLQCDGTAGPRGPQHPRH